MMKKENEELKLINDEYTEAIKIFGTKDYTKASKAFDKIIEEYKDSQSYSVLEIQTRAKVYKNICNAQLHPIEVKIENDEDQINYAILSLNSGNYNKAIELFEDLEQRKGKDAYYAYLASIAYLKKKDVDASLKCLKRAIKKDSFYKIIAFNEPDFSRFFDNEHFRSLVE